MIISTRKPPIYDLLRDKFGVRWDGPSGVIIAYGDTVYTASGGLTPDLRVHEQTHLDQQKKIGVDIWWKRYLDDKVFRFEQELEAYRNQAAYLRSSISNHKKLYGKLGFIWGCMASYYDGMCTLEEAEHLVPLIKKIPEYRENETYDKTI